MSFTRNRKIRAHGKNVAIKSKYLFLLLGLRAHQLTSLVNKKKSNRKKKAIRDRTRWDFFLGKGQS